METKSVVVAVRMDEETKAMWKRFAEREDRSLGNYLHRLLKREAERQDGVEVSLDSLRYEMLDCFERLRNELPKQKPRKEKTDPSPRDIVTDEDEVLTKESWLTWLEHVRLMSGYALNYAAAMQHYKEFCRLDGDGYDCDMLVKEITDRYTWKFPIIPNDWKQEKANGKGGGKPWWHDAK